jgi:hypothetical protein
LVRHRMDDRLYPLGDRDEELRLCLEVHSLCVGAQRTVPWRSSLQHDP